VSITTLTSREFNQDSSRAKQAAAQGPVIITDRGKPAHVLLTFVEYQKVTSNRSKIADLLAMPGVEDIDLPLVQGRDLARAAELG
jgi:PHD/YefM family antitoxin component YafN of YafNO toxin-antitoxin module